MALMVKQDEFGKMVLFVCLGRGWRMWVFVLVILLLLFCGGKGVGWVAGSVSVETLFTDYILMFTTRK